MADSAPPPSLSPSPLATTTATKSQTSNNSWIGLLVLFLAPVAVSLLIYRLDEFDSAQIPDEGLSWKTMSVPKHYDHILNATEKIGQGGFIRPEDLAYDAETGFIYATSEDGWIKRVRVTDSLSEAKVENFAHVGGRPLGLVLGQDGELIVAETVKGLMKVTKEGLVTILSDEAEGLKFKLTDGVDIARNGVIYFTDASYKYNFHQHMLDVLEGRPYGRLLSFDPSTNKTQVLVRDLYFANGVALSPKQDFVVYCETILRRCKKYYIEGDKKGSIDDFVDNLRGFPDNIRYDGLGIYWIGLPSAKTLSWDLVLRYPWLRKTMVILAKYVTLPNLQKDGGVLAVDLDGKPIALYTDPELFGITGGIRIADHLYYGSLVASYVSRVSLMHLPM
ncbi:yls2-like [Ranunculus cassubicifolius]